MPGEIDATDRWADRLSEYLDDELDAAERAELEHHLRVCPACARTLSEIEAVRDAGRALADTVSEPARDLWPGIASRIGALTPAGSGGSASADEPGHRVWRRRISLTLPQLAAAAVVLVVATGLVLAALSRGPDSRLARAASAGATPVASGTTGTAASPAGGPAGREGAGSASLVARSTPAASATPELDRAASDLEAVIARQRGGLDPATVKVLDHNVAVIDSAIAQIRAALARDPGDVYLNRSLTDAMRRKVDVLRLAAKLAGASS